MAETTFPIPAATEPPMLAGETLNGKNTTPEPQPASDHERQGCETISGESSSRHKKRKGRGTKKGSTPGNSPKHEMTDGGRNLVEDIEFYEKQVLYWRHKLQRGFLMKGQPPQADQMLEMVTYIENLEKYRDYLDVTILKKTKIHKVLKGLVKLSEIPRDEEFQFRERSQKLLDVWIPLLTSKPRKAKSSEKENGQTPNPTKAVHEEESVTVHESEEQKFCNLVEAAYDGDVDKVRRYCKGQECSTALYAACVAGREGVVDFLLGDVSEVYDNSDSYGSAFLTACQNGWATIVEKLIHANLDVLVSEELYGQVLREASHRGNDELVRLLLEVSDLFKPKVEDYAIAMRHASKAGNHKIVQWLLEKLDYMESTTDKPESLYSLLHAARKGHKGVVQLLLNIGVNAHACFDQSGTAMTNACVGGHKDIVELLLAWDVDVNYSTWESGSPIQAAASAGHNGVVKTLIDHGAEVNGSPSMPYRTALLAAVNGGHEEVVRTLLVAGAKPNAPANYPSWPIMVASEKGHAKIVDLLLSHGAKTEIHPCPIRAAMDSGHEEIVKSLVAAGADVKWKWIGPVLAKAVQNGWDETVLKFIEAGADPNAEAEDGRTVLSLATELGHEAIVKYLVEGGANVHAHPCGSSETCLNVKNKKSPSKRSCKQNLLETPTRSGHTGIVKILAEAGADVNVQFKDVGTPLHAACRSNNSEMVQTLLEVGADPNIKKKHNGQQDTPLITTVRENYLHLAQLLIDAGADVNATNRYYATALHIAAESGSEVMISKLIDAGASVDGNPEKRAWNSTPLTIACRKGFQDIARRLIGAGADLEFHDGILGTPLHVATSCGHKDIVQILIDAGAKVDSQNKDNKATPLILASQAGHHQIGQMLLNVGADVGHVCMRGDTALVRAAQHGDGNMVRLLIDAGAQVNERDSVNQPVLILAAENGHRDVVQILINAGADINAMTCEGETALRAAIYANQLEVTKLLLDHGASSNAGYHDSYSLLLPLCKSENVEALEMLIEAGVELNGRDNGDMTLLQHSVGWSLDNIVQILIRAGADINAKGLGGNCTALTDAIHKNNERMVRLLLEYGADVNCETAFTPLALASHLGLKDLAQICLEAGANINAKCHGNSRTALTVATGRNDEQMVRLLLEHGADVNCEGNITPLALASQIGFTDLVQVFLEAGADVNHQKNDRCRTALMWAVNGGHEEEVRLLLDADANISLTCQLNGEQLTALDLAKKMSATGAVIQMLEDASHRSSEIQNHEKSCGSFESATKITDGSEKEDSKGLNDICGTVEEQKTPTDSSDGWIRVELNPEENHAMEH